MKTNTKLAAWIHSAMLLLFIFVSFLSMVEIAGDLESGFTNPTARRVTSP